MSELIRQIKVIRHTQVIEDPFVEDKNINIYAAYQKGYDKAYAEIEEGLKLREDLNRFISEGMKNAYDELVETLASKLKTMIKEQNE